MAYIRFFKVLMIFLILLSFPAYAAPASPSNAKEALEEVDEWEEIKEEEREEYINQERIAQAEEILYRLDLIVSLLALLLGCLCASIFSSFWRFR